MKTAANQPHYSSRPSAKGVGVRFDHTLESRTSSTALAQSVVPDCNPYQPS